jgi:hypothetical protein
VNLTFSLDVAGAFDLVPLVTACQLEALERQNRDEDLSDAELLLEHLDLYLAILFWHVTASPNPINPINPVNPVNPVNPINRCVDATYNLNSWFHLGALLLADGSDVKVVARNFKLQV